LAAQSTSDASIGPADIVGFEEGEFEGDSPTEEVAAQIRLRGGRPGPTPRAGNRISATFMAMLAGAASVGAASSRRAARCTEARKVGFV
jgi:hypothetical protein